MEQKLTTFEKLRNRLADFIKVKQPEQEAVEETVIQPMSDEEMEGFIMTIPNLIHRKHRIENELFNLVDTTSPTGREALYELREELEAVEQMIIGMKQREDYENTAEHEIAQHNASVTFEQAHRDAELAETGYATHVENARVISLDLDKQQTINTLAERQQQIDDDHAINKARQDAETKYTQAEILARKNTAEDVTDIQMRKELASTGISDEILTKAMEKYYNTRWKDPHTDKKVDALNINDAKREAFGFINEHRQDREQL